MAVFFNKMKIVGHLELFKNASSLSRKGAERWKYGSG
jgi:hypothetical protein